MGWLEVACFGLAENCVAGEGVAVTVMAWLCAPFRGLISGQGLLSETSLGVVWAYVVVVPGMAFSDMYSRL